jgi:hypothetical protein
MPESKWKVCLPGPQPDPSVSVNLIEYGTPTVPAGHVFVYSPATFGHVLSEMPPAGASGANVRTPTSATVSSTDRTMVTCSIRYPSVLLGRRRMGTCF